MDQVRIHAEVLKVLGDLLLAMSSPEWDARLGNAEPADRARALALMLRLQEARVLLGNAALVAILKPMQAEEAALKAGLEAVSRSLGHLEDFRGLMDSAASLLAAVGEAVA
nr:hypothetical protein [uncultured Holophaga sp.]